MIRAAIECIAEEGLQRATAGRIVERSGVSWGGIQHQFGDKTGILDAVLEQLLRDLRDQVEQFSTRATSIEGRVRALVDAAWSLLRDPTYQAFREVMRSHTPSAGVRLDSEDLLQQVGVALLELCGELFPERRGSHKTLSLVSVILFATLSGMAEQQRYAVLEDSLTSRQLAVLRETLERVIGGQARA
ncbi:MAG: TetR family transcriptional regulator [Deltaproteobacteria bacterium]|nr:TetR family transcriptional regulator [Deltaproteobacteria bacterium]